MIELSEDAGNAMLDMLAHLMDGGSIELLADRSERVLAVLRFSSPAAMPASGKVLELSQILEEDSALARGNAAVARILSAGGNEIFSCDVGDLNSAAVIKLNNTNIAPGGPVRLNSFKVAWP